MNKGLNLEVRGSPGVSWVDFMFHKQKKEKLI